MPSLHRGKVQERQPHRLLQFPDGIGTDEHRRDMRLGRIPPGQPAQKRGGLLLLVGMLTRECSPGVRSQGYGNSLPMVQPPPACAGMPGVTRISWSGHAIGTACSAGTPEIFRGSPDSPTRQGGRGMSSPGYSSTRSRPGAAPAPPARPAGGTAPTPMHPAARRARAAGEIRIRFGIGDVLRGTPSMRICRSQHLPVEQQADARVGRQFVVALRLSLLV